MDGFTSNIPETGAKIVNFMQADIPSLFTTEELK